MEGLVIITDRMVKKPRLSQEWLCLKKSGDGSIIFKSPIVLLFFD